MNFIAVYIGHRCTLWFYTFTLNKYFSHSESVSPKEFGHELVYSLFLFYLSFHLWTPVSGRHLFPCSWPSSMVHCLLLGARLLQESGNFWSSPSSFSLQQPYAPAPQSWTFLAFLPCSPRQPNSACTCVKFGQDTAFCSLLGVAELCFHWCRPWSPRGSSVLGAVDLCLAVEVDGVCFYPSPRSPRRRRACCPSPSGLGFCFARGWLE